MVKLLMTWDLQPGKETALLEFMAEDFTRGLIKKGLPSQTSGQPR